MCIAYSTIPGYTSQSDIYKGSWFIKCLVETFLSYSRKRELIDLLRLTSNKLSMFTNSEGQKQTCCVEMRNFNKRLYFQVNSKILRIEKRN